MNGSNKKQMDAREFFTRMVNITQVAGYVTGEDVSTKAPVAERMRIANNWGARLRRWTPDTVRLLAKAFPLIDFRTPEEREADQRQSDRRDLILAEWLEFGEEMDDLDEKTRNNWSATLTTRTKKLIHETKANRRG